MVKQLSKIEFKPGVVKDESPLASEGGFIDSDLVRFRQGKPEAIGGWEKVTASTLTGSARVLHGWSDLSSNRHLAIATDSNLYVMTDNGSVTLTDIGADVTASAAEAPIVILYDADIAGDFINKTVPISDKIGTKTRVASAKVFVLHGANGNIFYDNTALSGGWTDASVAANDIAIDGANYAVVKQNGYIDTSTDLSTWTNRVSSGAALNTVKYLNSTAFVAVGASGRITTSPYGGTTWTARTSGTSNAIQSVDFGASVYVAVGEGVSSTTASTANIRSSSDLATWTARASNVSGILYDVVFANSLFVAVGANGVISTSSDGLTWTSQASGTTNTLRAVFWDGGEFLACGDRGVILSSSDGATWTTVTTNDYTTFFGGVSLSSSNSLYVGASYQIVDGGSSSTTIYSAIDSVSSASPFSLDNFGEVLLMAAKTGGLYCWQPGPYSETVENGTFATDTIWAKGTGWTIGSGVATKAAGVASNLSQAATDLRPGYVYELRFLLARTAGSVTFKVNAGGTPTLVDVGIPNLTMSGQYVLKFVCPDDPSDIAFVANSTFAGTVDAVSVKLASSITQVTTAPSEIGVMWVDPNARIVNIGNTIEADGDKNTLCVRNSAQESFRVWVPDVNNIADEVVLGRGSKIVGAKVTRQQTLIWTDAALFTQQFSGSAAATYIYRMAATGCGLIGRSAAAEVEGAVFWLGQNGQFYAFNGQTAQIVESRIRRDVMDNLASGYGDRVFAGVNGAFSEVWFCYPDARLSGSPECNKVAAYNYVEQHWVTHNLARTAWMTGGVWPYPIATTPAGIIYYHEKGQSNDGTAAFLPTLETGYFDIEDGNNIMSVTRVVPDFEEQSATVNFTVKTKYWPNASELSAGPFAATTTANYLHMRRLGRQMKLVMETVAPGAGYNVFWRLGALRAVFEKTGALR